MRHPALAPPRRARLLAVAATITLLMGYVDLARGGTTLAPVLLVVAHLVLVPAVILTWR
ncbi:MAG: hypothetical protein ABJA80_12025 [bacterium]